MTPHGDAWQDVQVERKAASLGLDPVWSEREEHGKHVVRVHERGHATGGYEVSLAYPVTTDAHTRARMKLLNALFRACGPEDPIGTVRRFQ